MNKFFLILVFFAYTTFLHAEKKVGCETAIEKLKPSCNIGKAFNKLRSFSDKNKTIGQSLGNVGILDNTKINKKPTTLKEFSEKHKTIDKTIKEIRKK